ncbi:MAG: hypothetical protein JRJ87_20825 [Deltaproteobacteria bacterium]|nr:hypothetical protein [Deltaproteobacteria bacterium]
MPDEFDLKLSIIEQYYQRVFKHLDPNRLQHHREDWPVDETNQQIDPGDESDSTFLDYYSVEGLRLALEEYGFLAELRAKGISNPRLSLHRHKEGYDIFRIHRASSPHLIVELVAQQGPLSIEAGKFIDGGDRRFLNVRWLRMQNPLSKPSPKRPLLPGQDFPGLGLGREMMVLLQLICARLNLDGVIELPERIHNAAMYFKRFCFVDPEMQGILTAILRDTRDRKLADLSWGIELGLLIDQATSKPYRWIAKEQVLPRIGPICEYFNSSEYKEKARAAMEQNHFQLKTGDFANGQAIVAGQKTEDADNPFPSRIK